MTNRPIHAPIMTMEEAAEKLSKALGPHFQPPSSHAFEGDNALPSGELIFAIRLIKALHALGVIEVR